jgi:Group II intron, maturase-specific domain
MLKMRIIAGFEVAEILMLTAGVLLVGAILFAIWALPPAEARLRPHRQLSVAPSPEPALVLTLDSSLFCGFTPAVSVSAMKALRTTIRELGLRHRTELSMADIARQINPLLRGWIAYYGRYAPSALNPMLRYVNLTLRAWVMRKFKRFAAKKVRAGRFLERMARDHADLFVHWRLGLTGVFAWWELSEARVSRSVLRAADGASPTADSPTSVLPTNPQAQQQPQTIWMIWKSVLSGQRPACYDLPRRHSHPHLPEPFSWPQRGGKPLHFLGQIDCAIARQPVLGPTRRARSKRQM